MWLSCQLHLCGLGQIIPLSCASLLPHERRALEAVMIFQGCQQTGDCWAGMVLPKLLVGPPSLVQPYILLTSDVCPYPCLWHVRRVDRAAPRMKSLRGL